MARRKEPKEKLIMDFSNEAVDEPILNAVADAVDTAGTLTHQVAIDVGGTTYYLYAYTTGTVS